MWTIRDKVCVVTGATSGIGKETALGLARQGAHLALVGRDRGRGDAAVAEVRAAGSPQVELFLADFSRQDQVRRLAGELGQRLPTIDVLLHNAGVVMRERRLTTDGVEATLATNHLAPFLLTQLVRDKLSQASRVIMVASQVEARGHIDFDDLHFAHTPYEPLAAYCRSKLANVLFTYELARRLRDTDITANCLHPGVIATNLLCDYMGRPRVMNKLHRLTHPKPKQGAQVSIRLATDPALDGVSGRYFRPEGEASSSKASYDPELARRLWEVSEQLTGLAS
ncbi:SDR family oxidoreductase [Haliangium sp.]|uniref:SDR family oxidoreductase n=1 Tax=Haliangium sp. TaxID=2663208 RepID=UPI003D12F0D8